MLKYTRKGAVGFFLLGWWWRFSHAWPFEAGSCPEGRAAVGGAHFLKGSPVTGPLAKGGIVLTIEGEAAASVDSANTTSWIVESKRTLSLLLQGQAMRGILVRMGGGAILIPNSGNVKVSDTYCSPQGAGSLTHTHNQAKTLVTAEMIIPDNGIFPVDVTVVVANNQEEGSIFYYSSFLIQAQDFPTAAPTLSPSFQPTASPTESTDTPTQSLAPSNKPSAATAATVLLRGRQPLLSATTILTTTTTTIFLFIQLY